MKTLQCYFSDKTNSWKSRKITPSVELTRIRNHYDFNKYSSIQLEYRG